MIPITRPNLTVVCIVLLLHLISLENSQGAPDSVFPRIDLTNPDEANRWKPLHDVSNLEPTPEGLVIQINGSDPYIAGPARDYPEDTPLWVTVRLKSESTGMAQIFYFTDTVGTAEERSARFPVVGGDWREIRAPLPSFGKGQRLRFDPPGENGQTILASFTFEKRVLLKEPEWPKPQLPRLALLPGQGGRPRSLTSGDLEILCGDAFLDDLLVRVEGEPFASSLTEYSIGYVTDGKLKWVNSRDRSSPKSFREIGGGGFEMTLQVNDPDGGQWELHRAFSRGQVEGSIKVRAGVSVNQDREVVFLPMFAVLPGVGSFGESKNRGLLAGLEYLADEPSSSTADVVFPQSQRQVPDSLKIAFPLMAVQAEGRYLGLIWKPQEHFAALFDSPDRLFQSGGHVMGVLFPGSDGVNRVEGNLLPYEGRTIKAGEWIQLEATLIGGQGDTVVPAIQKYIALEGLPEVPDVEMDFQGYVNLAAKGWLDSPIREGDLFSHAIFPNGGNPHPVAGPSTLMRWLAAETQDATLASRLSEVAESALQRVAPKDYNTARVSHIGYPVQALLFGHLEENLDTARRHIENLKNRFEKDGSVPYKPQEGKPDFGKTHFAPDANGLAAPAVEDFLTTASFIGDPESIDEGIGYLRALDKFDGAVPRGAQTWEVPLHTPDILASAHLVRAYTLGYELTGEEAFLERARYWAWTGVPFVYLTNPAGQKIGLYATTPVFGATHWVAPVWMGLPVQWCGLVYSHALYQFLKYDPTGPWKRIADGITASGIQQTWPAADPDYHGLLPDSISLRPQIRNLAAINPGTVQTNAVYFFDRTDIYSFRSFRKSGALLHAPGRISDEVDEPGSVSFKVESWYDSPYSVMAIGIPKQPEVIVDGNEFSSFDYTPEERRLVLRLEGTANVGISWEPK